MGQLTRRDFLLYGSAALYEVSYGSSTGRAQETTRTTPATNFEKDSWEPFGRLHQEHGEESIVLNDGYLISKETWRDTSFSFRARAPHGTEQVQIWAGLRASDRDRRYVFGMRGGNNDDVYLARYAPDGGDRFLGIAPLHFHPEPGAWYQLRAVIRGNRIHIYVNNEAVPRINVEDTEALWSEGGVSLGGGWLPVEFKDILIHPLTDVDAAAFDKLGKTVFKLPEPDREKKRAQQRSAYKGIHVASIDDPRTEISLDGDWLFMPSQELQKGATPQSAHWDDAEWHVMDVPHMWTPTLTWLHGETGFQYLDGLSATKGISDRLFEDEISRLDGYTFPWRETRSAWYRQYIDLPSDISDRNFEICFDAIAKVSEIWVNGIKVGAHIGMFGEVRCDVTSAIRPGRNVVAVYVRGRLDEEHPSSEVVGVAVTVEVTASMLHSLPHGMYRQEASGIWQPARLLVTHHIAVEDIFINPKLDGLDCQLTLRKTAPHPEKISISYSITSEKGGAVLHASNHKIQATVEGANKTLHFSTPTLAPKLWSPQEPNLYHLEVILSSGDKVLDRKTTTFGFRTFTVEKEKFLLNGKPFWLRGGNHFPHALRPNDKKLAHRFMQLAREGNVLVTRSHTAPFTKTWLDAADEAGIAVSYEGTWPWLMLEGDPPDEALLHAWKDEFASLIRKYRNHPSIILWTVNNEMKFEVFDAKKPELLKKKWAILSDMVKTIRSIDATRPVVCDSSYYRKQVETEYKEFILPNGFDDGDVDDAHRYPGWYEPSFFHFAHGEFGKKLSWPDRPLISQEMATGYPRNDDGHPTRFYLFKHYTPQSLVGDEAYEHRDPSIFLRRQAFITKELAETIRRTNRETCSGILHFAYLTWFKDAWNADTIQPFTTYYALKSALQPVLVSLELRGRHFYAGSKLKTRACIVNDSDSGSSLPPSELIWEIRDASMAIASGKMRVPEVPYYANQWIDISIPIPAILPKPRIDGSLVLRLENNGTIHSINYYDVTLATSAWAKHGFPPTDSFALFDPYREAPEMLYTSGITPIASLDALTSKQHLILAGSEKVLAQPQAAEYLRRFISSGGKALILHAGARLAELYPDRIRSFRSCAGEIAGMHIPESEVFSGIEPLDLSWFEQGAGMIPRACSGVYRINSTGKDATALAHLVDCHGYLKKPEDVVQVNGSPLVSLHIDKGAILACEMMLNAAKDDPIAGRLLTNLLLHFNENSAQDLR